MSPDLDRLNLLLTLGRHAEGEKAAREAIAANPEWAAGYGFLALFLSNQGHHLPAIRAARDCVGKNPHDPWAHAVRASVLNRLGRTDQALAAADEAIRLDPTYIFAYRVRCEILCIERRHSEARIAAREGLRHHPSDEMLLHWRGWAEYMTGRLDAARDTAEEGLRTHPDSSALRNVLGCALKDKAAEAGPIVGFRHHLLAEAAFREAVRLRPGEPAYQDNRRTNALTCRWAALWPLTLVAVVLSGGATLLGIGAAQPASSWISVFLLGAGVVGYVVPFLLLWTYRTSFILAAPVAWLRLPTVPLLPSESRPGRVLWAVVLGAWVITPLAAWIMALAVRL